MSQRMPYVCAAAGVIFALLCPAGSVLSVSDYGAQADDDKDDAPALVKALEAATAGDTIGVPEGTFLLGSAVVIAKPGIAVTGAGREKTILRHAGKTKHAILSVRETLNVEIRDLTLDGADSPMATNGLSGWKSSNVNVHHIAVSNLVDTGTFGPHGIAFHGCPDVTISDCSITNIAPDDEWGAGIRVGDYSARPRILRNVIHNTGRGGIFTNNHTPDGIVRENIVTGSHGIKFAIEIHSGSDRTLVEDNLVDHGLSIVSNNCALRRNIVIDTTGSWGSYGIESGGGPNGIITDNIIENGQLEGIDRSGGREGGVYQFWSRNRFANCSQWGMQLMGHSAEQSQSCLYFYKNTFANMKSGHPSARYPGHDGQAIRFHSFTQYIVFDSNRIEDNAGFAVQLCATTGIDHLAFIDNIIVNNRKGVMNQFDGTAIVWEGNFVAGNGSQGIVPQTKGVTCERPVANFTCPDSVAAGTPVRFTNSSRAPGSEIGHVLWDFGAGIGHSEQDPEFTYDRPGSYTVSLVVWNKERWAGRPAQKTIWVTSE